MFEFHDIEQNSDDWFKLRAGRLTSSKLAVIMANYGKAFGEPAKKYARQIAVEQITGKPATGGYTNDHMERGHEQEPIARQLYEDETFSSVTNGGFFSSDFIGCSPDGLIDSDGVIEIKSAIASVHFDRVSKSSYDSQYKWQLIGNMKFPRRDWIDFVSYCSDFPIGKRLYVCRLLADKFNDEFEMIDERIELFESLVKQSKEIILNSSYFNEIVA